VPTVSLPWHPPLSLQARRAAARAFHTSARRSAVAGATPAPATAAAGSSKAYPISACRRRDAKQAVCAAKHVL
jgi:hypothetical protein